MSHISDLKLVIKDLTALKAAAMECGLVFSEAETYRWFGRVLNGYPIPDGFSTDDLGHCSYKLSIPDNAKAYEIGVVRNKFGQDGYTLLYDSWGPGAALLSHIGGESGGLLKQKYAVHAATRSAWAQGYRVEQTQGADGNIQLRMEK